MTFHRQYCTGSIAQTYRTLERREQAQRSRCLQAWTQRGCRSPCSFTGATLANLSFLRLRLHSNAAPHGICSDQWGEQASARNAPIDHDVRRPQAGIAWHRPMKPIRRVCAGRVGGMLAQRKTGKVAFAGPSWPTDATLCPHRASAPASYSLRLRIRRAIPFKHRESFFVENKG